MRNLRPFFVLLFILLAARLIYSHFVPVGIYGDAGSYLGITKNLVEKGYYGSEAVPDFARPPLYSLLLAGFIKLGFPFGYWTYVLLNCIFDSLSMYFLVKVAKRIAPGTGYLGLFLVAISPMWFTHVNSPICESLSILTFMGFLERWTREKRTQRDEIVAGLWLGLLTLCRAMFLWLPVSIVLFEFIHFRAPKGVKLEPRRIIPFIVAGFVPPLTWGVRNYFVAGKFAVTQDSWTAVMMAWYAIKLPLLDWRMDEHVQWIRAHKWSDALYGRIPLAQLGPYSDMMKAEIFDFIRNEPLTYLWNLFPKTLRLWVNGWWNPFNYAFSPRHLGSLYIWSFAVPVLAFGSLGLLQQWGAKTRAAGESAVSQWRAVRIQLSIVIYITALTLPFTVDARYSVIAYVMFGLWAGRGILLLFQPKE